MSRPRMRAKRALLSLLLLGAPLAHNSALAQLPTGADVVAGQAVISQGIGAINVDASTSRSIVNWESFNVGANNTVNFNLPGADSAILNRVNTPNMPSIIAGAVNSNGNVYLVNPSGILVTSSGTVNTNGFTASTFDIGNDAFMAGGPLTFRNAGSGESVINEGNIATGAGGAHLIAKDIINRGLITSEGGDITLAGGGSVTLSNGVRYSQPTMETLASGISPTAGLIQNEGVIRATGAATTGGEVYLVNPNGKILHDGTITGVVDLAKDPGTEGSLVRTSTGGRVQLEADDISLTARSTIDASGTHGGGDVLVGGDWQGSGNMTQATSVTMEAGATIDASATASGDGGKIVLWSDIANADSITKAFGTLVATAGELFGDGGNIETSGATIETDGIAVNAGAENGEGGLWLIDPFDYTIDASAATSIVSALNSGTSVEVTTTSNNASFGSSGNSSDNGDITVAADIITGAMSGDASLTLKAARHIIVSAANGIDATQNGNTAELNVKLWADSDNSGDGISIVSSPTIATNGGSLTFGNGDTASIGGVNTLVGGDLYLNGALAQTLDTAGGDITVNGETILANTNGVTFDSGGGDILFDGVINSGNAYTGVTSTQTWTGAVTDAQSGTGDQLGDTYLATITSRLENALAGIAVDYNPAWLGGRRVTGIGTDSFWRWVTGPEALLDSGNGLVFADQNNSGGATAVNDAFNNWNGNEPNNWNGSAAASVNTENESALQFTGTAGNWNDLPRTSTTLTQYVRETNLAPSSLTVDAGSGSVTFNDGVGGGKALSSLNVMSSGVTVNGTSLATTGTQTYNSAVTANSSFGLQVAGSTLTSSGAFDFTAADNVSLDASLASTADISITSDQIVLGGSYSIDSGSGDLTLNTDDVTGGALTLNTTGHFTYAPRNSAWDSGAIGSQLDYTGTIISDTFTGASDVSWLTIDNYSSLGGLTLGKDGNTSQIYVYNPIVVNGDVNLIGSDITLADDIDTSTAAGSDILIKANDTWNVAASGVELDAGSGDITVRADTFNWDDRDPTFRTTGNAAILPFTDSSSFTHTAVKSSWFIFDAALGSLQIGHDANTSGVEFNTNVAIGGPVNLYGGDISLNADLTSTLAGADIFVKAIGDITQASNVDVTTDGGDVTYWSDAGASNDGYVSLRSGSNIFTGGGNIVIGGGVDSGSDGVPDGAATGQALLIDSGTFYSGISLHEATLDTRSGGTLDAAAGDIALNGTSTYTGGHRAVGVLLYTSKLIGDVVDVTGSVTHTGGTTTRYGISSNGGTAPNNTNIQAFGGITLTGNAATPADQYSIRWGTNHEMSVVDGDIAINSNGQLQYLSSQTLTLADTRSLIFNSDYDAEWRNIVAGDGGLIKQGAGTLELTRQNTYAGATTISDGHLIIRNDAPSITTSEFNGTGTLTVESDASSFSSPLSFGAAVNGLSSLTVGKSTNTADINFTENIASSGPISVYGGTLDFAGTLSAGSNDILLAANDLGLADTVSSTGALTIETQTSGTTIGVGTATGSLTIDNSELANLQEGFSSITIGDSTSGDLSVGGLVSLTDDLTLRAGSSSDLNVVSELSWATDHALTLAAGQDINILSDISVSGSAATLNLLYGGTDGSSAPTGGTNYYIDVANRRHIRFDETTAGLKIGNESFTLVGSVSALQGMATDGRYALAGNLSLAGTTYTDAFYSNTFTGKLDGLGNEVDGLTIRASNGANYGLFGLLGNASVRHLGVINIDLLGQSTTNNAADDLRIGGIAGNVSGSGTTLFDGVWATGVIATKQGSQQDVFYAGGLAGGHDSGTFNITRAYSTVNVSSQGSHSQKMGLGGLVGDSGNTNGVSSIGGSAVHISIDGAYSTGSIVEGTYAGYYGSGGLLGVGWGNSVTIQNSFSRSNVVGGISSGGLLGVTNTGVTHSITDSYTTLDRFGNGVSPTNTYKGDTLNAATNNGTQLPSGWSSDIWTVGEFPTLKAVGVPASLLYVQVLGGTGVYGDLATPTYQIVDADGNVVNFGTGDYSNLDGVTGTGRYTLGQFTNAGTYNSVSYLSGLGLTGDDANLYALNPFTTAGSFTITPRSITAVLSATGVDKVYDGNVNAGSGYSPTWSFTNIVSGDSATLNLGSSFFNAADVLDANLFTINGLSLAGITGSNGSLVSDYVLANTSASVAANITPKPIVIENVLASDKIYDGTTAATVDGSSLTFNGIVSGDNLTLDSVSGVFIDENVAASKTVNLSGVLGGTDASNYSISGNTTTADITAKAITISGVTASNKVYDGTTSAVVDASGLTLNGIVGGDDLTASGTTGVFSDKNVANGKAVTLSGTTLGGADLGNYSITDQGTATADITPKAIAVSGLAANDRIYDGTTTTNVDHSGVAFTGIVSGDNLTASGTTGSFADKNVGTSKSVTLSGTNYGGTDVGNYTFTDQTSSTADITAKAITVSGITANNRIYDGTTAATLDVSGLTYNGLVGGDDLTASNTTGVFGDKNVANGKTVTLSSTTYAGADLNNYSITDQTSTTADITAKAVTVSGLVANDRVYDGTTDATVDHTGVTFTGIVSGDNLTASGTTGAFADKNVADGKAVTLSGTTYGGTDVNNYSFTDQTSSTADITPKSITVSGLTVDNRVYDSTTGATVDHSGVTFTGVVDGDNLTASGTTGTFDSKNIGNGKSVTLAGTTYGGSDVNNYTFTDQSSTTADVSPFALSTSGITANDKIYDSTTTATLSGTASANTFAGDDVSLETNYIANFASANVGDDQAISISGFSLSGSDATNYTLAQPTGITADITPAQLVITANNDSKFVTKSDVFGYAGATFDGFVGTEGIGDLGGSLSITRSGSDEAAGTYTDVLNASGLTATNYDISFVSGDYSIIPAEQFLIRFGNSSTTYGGSLGFDFLSAEYMDAGLNVSTLTPVVNGNDYSFDDGVGGTAQFTLDLDGAALSSSGHTNAGTFQLTMGSLIASGGNFSDNINLFGTHTVNRADLIVGTGGVSKTYDGNATMNNLTLNLTGIVVGDTVNISGQGSYSDRNAGTGLSYSVANLELSGADANNYTLPGGTTLTGSDGVINTKNVTIDAPTVTKVYDGNADFAPTIAQLQNWTDALDVAGDTVGGITLTYDDKNVGTGKTLTPSAINISDGNSGNNYNITFTNDIASSITRLSSVTWIGGLSGDWNDPANWAGGAVPDLANVANVIIPDGVTPTFSSDVAGPVELDSLTGGNLTQDGGTLDVVGDVSLLQLTQNGGTLDVNGDFTTTELTQTGGHLGVGGRLNTTQDFHQSPGATITVGGDADINNSSGDLIVHSLAAGNVTLFSPSGGVVLGDVATTGDLTANAGNGDVAQTPTSILTVGGESTFVATGDVTLDGNNNDFQGTVNATADEITLTDSTGNLELGDINAAGDLDLTANDGDVTQSEGSEISVAGETTVAADGDIDLSTGTNNFADAVNLDAANAEVTQSTGDLTLQTVNTIGNFWADAPAGNILQTPAGTINIGGNATFLTNGKVELLGNNNLAGDVETNSLFFNINSLTPFTPILTGKALVATTRTAEEFTFDTFGRYGESSGEQEFTGLSLGVRSPKAPLQRVLRQEFNRLHIPRDLDFEKVQTSVTEFEVYLRKQTTK